MPRRKKTKISAVASTLIKTAVSTALANGRVHVRVLANKLYSEHRSEWADWSTELMLDSITGKIRKLCKQAVTKEEETLFPGAPEHLPRAIAVPGSTKKNGYYIALRRATLSEGKRALAALIVQAAKDQRRIDALTELLDSVELAGGRGSDRIVDVMAPVPA